MNILEKTKNILTNYPIGLFIIAGLLPAIVYELPGLASLLIIPAFWLLIYLTINITSLTKTTKSNRKTLVKIFSLGTLAGATYMAYVLRWHLSAWPLDSMGISNDLLSLVVIFYAWLSASLVGGLSWGILALCIFKFKRYQALVWPLFLGLIFGFLELARSSSFSILWLGPGTTFGDNWSNGATGYALANLPIVANLGPYLGVYGLGGLAFTLALYLYFSTATILNRSTQKLDYKVLLVSIFILLIFIFPTSDSIGSGVDSRQVSPTGDKPLKIGIIAEEMKNITEPGNFLTKVAEKESNLDMLIFPEDASFFKAFYQNSDPSWRLFFRDIPFKKEVIMVDSDRLYLEDNPKAVGLTYVISNKKPYIRGHSEKAVLVPHGEYIPFLTASFLKLGGFSELLSQYRKNRELAPGQSLANIKVGSAQFHPILCSEIMSTKRLRAIPNGLPILNISSYSWFPADYSLYNQTVKMATFIAKSKRAPVIHVNDTGSPYIINSTGEMNKGVKKDNLYVFETFSSK